MEHSATFPDLAGKVAIVTGIGQIGTRELWGNGAATARLLCHNGVKVFGCDIDIDAAAYTKTRIEAEGGTVEITQADVTSSVDVKRLVSECMAKFGRVDILVNNVGRSEPGGPAEMEENIWDAQAELNIKSVYLTCHEVLPIMEAQKTGAVVNVASIAGMRYIGKPQVAYSTFKAGVMQFTKATAVIYAAKGVRLNTVVPGLMNTPLMVYLANKYAGGDLEGFSGKRDKAVPMGKQGDSSDVANAIVFLASGSAKYITGQELVVDGGITSSTG
ncbi:uncharacterized protein NECHADRAFT_95362 [Fusarium vanettenii 77-13-4]|uniref:Uncharacterized protein n=1 Tax=Fusarium vanettenii (strain ATCC MYA-4622 / CBS 123669 / FGSC 9596 / NRRL 45880 / 77-13-4) TaxID=660122 RepID=C7YY45_FUSV7|nr:uncharacterized protein NECHADRAFT_95362 [Fusarium vanettenii 77-13-4]EEU42935.1 hypothetical protein NECHADRAFT_95362 [Fusarium vanettenii 77-13-4]